MPQCPIAGDVNDYSVYGWNVTEIAYQIDLLRGHHSVTTKWAVCSYSLSPQLFWSYNKQKNSSGTFGWYYCRYVKLPVLIASVVFLAGKRSDRQRNLKLKMRMKQVLRRMIAMISLTLKRWHSAVCDNWCIIDVTVWVVTGISQGAMGLPWLMRVCRHFAQEYECLCMWNFPYNSLCPCQLFCCYIWAPDGLDVLGLDVAGRRQLRSASRGLLCFPRYNMSNYGRRAFSYSGPHAWNLLAENVQKSTSIAIFKRSLKTFLFLQIMHPAHKRRFSFRLMGYTSGLSNSNTAGWVPWWII